jgi:hypothetical protein
MYYYIVKKEYTPSFLHPYLNFLFLFSFFLHLHPFPSLPSFSLPFPYSLPFSILPSATLYMYWGGIRKELVNLILSKNLKYKT